MDGLCSDNLCFVIRNTFWEVHEVGCNSRTPENRARAESAGAVFHHPRKSDCSMRDLDEQSTSDEGSVTCETSSNGDSSDSFKDGFSSEEDLATGNPQFAHGEHCHQEHGHCMNLLYFVNFSVMPESKPVPDTVVTRNLDISPPVVRDEHAFTTIIMRNLPSDFKRSALLELLNAEGFFGVYDFVYIPADFCNWLSYGFAFVNFSTHAAADRARSHFDQFDIDGVLCVSGWSENFQGLQPHVDRYRNSPVMHRSVPDEYKPALFIQGAPVPMPPPTKRILRPRTGGRRPQFAKNIQ